jgi:hypothetical protein
VPEKQISKKSVQDEVGRHFIVSSQLNLLFRIITSSRSRDLQGIVYKTENFALPITVHIFYLIICG